MTLDTYFRQHTPPVTAAITAYLSERQQVAATLTPHLVQSIEVLAEFCLRGGKRVRSILVLLGTELAGGQLSPASYQVAAAVELFHKHILNLDDMADRDEVRNGGPTLWKRYQDLFADWKDASHHARSFSEIDGTLLGSFAFELVRQTDLTADQKLAVMEVLHTQMYFETVAGWQIHYYQNQEPLATADESEFIKGLDLVTARYTFVGPLRIGLILAGINDPLQVEVITRYGLKVGLAFQITDDILGVFGDPEQTGKAVGNDIREGKKTLLLQRAYRAASAADQDFLAAVCGQPITAVELQRVQEIITQTGSLQSSLELAQQQLEQAIQELRHFAVTTPTAAAVQQVLIELAHFVGQRKK